MDFLSHLFDQLEPTILEALSVLLMAVIVYVSNLIRRKTGLDIEARHREALHSAIMTGVLAAIKEGPDEAKEMLVQKAIGYARVSVPQAISHFGPDNFILRRLAERYANEALERIEAKLS
ncbi:hypothetical protein QEZ52_00220 [Aliisedimentitalea scapharcae]|uniref:Bacteriophage holin of superfamily 6 (Holin_LLH) n=1 Tax=Aliisedimentitalea scapharcae TaxID=1524259 RepID=A0ABZ2XTJ9_9RHOB